MKVAYCRYGINVNGLKSSILLFKSFCNNIFLKLNFSLLERSHQMPALSLNRCICVHSMAQIVDIVFQNLLFQRQFISEPMQQLKKYEPNCKAVMEYERVKIGFV